MKRNTPEHWKMDLLMSELGISRAQAVGHLELLFHFTAKQAPHGNIGKVPDEYIAKKCGWEQDAKKFITALVKCGWVDVSDEHRYVVHDWHEHCDDATKKAVTRSKKNFAIEDSPPKRRIYAIQASESKRIKIGSSDCPAEFRLLQLQTGCPEKLIVLAEKFGDTKEEFRLHKLFAAHSVNGEWFHGHDDIIEHVRQWQTVADMPRGDVCLPSLARPSLAMPCQAQPVDPCVADFPLEVQRQADEVFQKRWFALKGQLPNYERQDAKQELREIADKINSRADGYEKLMGYFAKPPPPDLGQTPKLWMIFRYLFEGKNGNGKQRQQPEGHYSGLEAPTV